MWNINNIQYGIRQANTRIEEGLFIPIYYNERYIRCQALHLYTPEMNLKEILTTNTCTYAVMELDINSPFCEKIEEYEKKLLDIGEKNKSIWWQNNTLVKQYKSAFVKTPSSLLWYLQIPDSGIFTCYDTSRKSWYASNEDGLKNKKWRILARTSGIWVDKKSYGVEWKIIGAYV